MSPMFHTARRRVHPSLVLSAATVVLFTIAMLVPIAQAKAETTCGAAEVRVEPLAP